MSNSPSVKEAEGLSYQELKDLLVKKKDAEIDRVTKELTAAEGIVASLKAQLSNLGVTASPAPNKRGRKPKNAFNLGGQKAGKKGKAKRGAVGESIRTFLASKGKAGAKISEMASALGFKPANVTAFFYSKNNRKVFKKVAPATFAIK